MSRRSPNPTMQDVAERLGLSRSTISLALRNHPSIPEATRGRVRETVAEMGYRPNPMVAALMSQLRSPHAAAAATLAIITRFPRRIADGPRGFYAILGESIYQTAESLGYRVSEFFTGVPGMTGRRLNQILLSRGIQGILLFPGTQSGRTYPDLEWSHFTSVMIGYGIRNSCFHQVASDYLHDMDMALARLREFGYRRIGFAVAPGVDSSTDFSWSSRYFVYQHTLPRRQRLEMIQWSGETVLKSDFMEWVTASKPDVVIISDARLAGWLREEGYRIPEDIGVLNIVQRSSERLPEVDPALSGVDPNTREVGAVAVETLSSYLQTNQKGLPDIPHLMLVKGIWVPGASLRQVGEPC